MQLEAHVSQRRYSISTGSVLPRRIEVTLDKLDRDEQLLFLEQLELEAERMSRENIEIDFAESIGMAVDRSIEVELSNEPSEELKRNPVADAMGAFLHFLDYGTLPLWFTGQGDGDLERAITANWDAIVAHPNWNHGLVKELPNLLGPEKTRRRLTLQFSCDFLRRLLELPAPQLAHNITLVLERLQEVPASRHLLATVRKALWEAAFAALAARKVPTEREMVASAWQALPATLRHEGGLRAGVERCWPGATDATHDEQKTAKPGEPERFNDEMHPDVEDGVQVNNAGVVILHPFLPRLFEALKITGPDVLLQPERGICLLQYLVTGTADVPEYQAALTKILCGVPLLKPVRTDVHLTKAERKACTELLETLVMHWGGLGNSSPDGLRGSFLLRPGMLTRREEGDWVLRVESSGIDSLLKQLPWGNSVIQLPWMPYVLWVEWN